MPKKLTLKQARTAKGLTQQELQAISGVNQRNISKLERRKSSEPLFSTGLALADALELDPHNLKFGSEAVA